MIAAHPLVSPVWMPGLPRRRCWVPARGISQRVGSRYFMGRLSTRCTERNRRKEATTTCTDCLHSWSR